MIGPEIGGARTRSGQLLLFRAAFQDPAVLDALLEVEHPKRDLDEVLVGISTLHREQQVKSLLDNGADPNARLDDEDVTSSPIWQCAFARESSPEVLRLLLDRGADPSIPSERGSLPADSCSLALQAVFLERGLLADPGKLSPPSGYVGIWPWWADGTVLDVSADYRFAICHPRPSRPDHADFLIAAEVIDGPAGPRAVEQLWVRRVQQTRFEICCVPFACGVIALGDIVDTSETTSCPYVATAIAQSSGHVTVAVSLDRSDDPHELLEVIEPLGVVAELVEAPGSGHAIAIDVSDSETLNALVAAIQDFGCDDSELSVSRSRVGTLDVAIDTFRWDAH